MLIAPKAVTSGENNRDELTGAISASERVSSWRNWKDRRLCMGWDLNVWEIRNDYIIYTYSSRLHFQDYAKIILVGPSSCLVRSQSFFRWIKTCDGFFVNTWPVALLKPISVSPWILPNKQMKLHKGLQPKIYQQSRSWRKSLAKL